MSNPISDANLDELVTTFKNGNRKDVYVALFAMSQVQAMYASAWIADQLNIQDRDIFLRLLLNRCDAPSQPEIVVKHVR